MRYLIFILLAQSAFALTAKDAAKIYSIKELKIEEVEKARREKVYATIESNIAEEANSGQVTLTVEKSVDFQKYFRARLEKAGFRVKYISTEKTCLEHVQYCKEYYKKSGYTCEDLKTPERCKEQGEFEISWQGAR